MTRPDFTITAEDARAIAASARVCGRPMLRRVHDRATGTEEVVPIPCGSTREAVCPACAGKARIIRIEQCTEGWHLTDEPERGRGDDDGDDEEQVDDPDDDDLAGKRARSTKRRQNLPDLPKLTMSDRTIGQVFTTPAGKQYRPSMFATCTLPSYGPVLSSGAPKHPGTYDYRRAALDALHFSKLCGRLWSNLRRCAGFNVQYFSVIEAQRRGAPHLHATIRGAISPGRSSARSSPPPTTPCGGPRSTRPSTSTGSPSGPVQRMATPTPTPVRSCRPGARRSTGSTLTRTPGRRI
jgi:hypothetical protein